MFKLLSIIVLLCVAVVLVATVIQMLAPILAVLFLGWACWRWIVGGPSSDKKSPES